MLNFKKHLKISFCVLFFLFTSFVAFGQSYLGWANQAANLRSGPGTNYEILRTLPAGSQLFIYSLIGENNFYRVKDIATDTDGYISSSLIELGQIITGNDPAESPFEAIGRSTTNNPQIQIFNNTNLILTLTLNNERHVFRSQETRTISVAPGRYNYMASAPGVIPYFGNDTLQNYYIYSWTFYIGTY
jgi:hypothetical protein